MFTRDLWQQAYITYEDPKSIDLFHTQWSRFIYNDCVRVYLTCLTPKQVKQRNHFRIRLTNLPFNTSAIDLQDITLATKAKALYIPRSNNYKPRPFVVFYFKTEADLNNAMQ